MIRWLRWLGRERTVVLTLADPAARETIATCTRQWWGRDPVFLDDAQQPNAWISFAKTLQEPPGLPADCPRVFVWPEKEASPTRLNDFLTAGASIVLTARPFEELPPGWTTEQRRRFLENTLWLPALPEPLPSASGSARPAWFASPAMGTSAALQAVAADLGYEVRLAEYNAPCAAALFDPAATVRPELRADLREAGVPVAFREDANWATDDCGWLREATLTRVRGESPPEALRTGTFRRWAQQLDEFQNCGQNIPQPSPPIAPEQIWAWLESRLYGQHSTADGGEAARDAAARDQLITLLPSRLQGNVDPLPMRLRTAEGVTKGLILARDMNNAHAHEIMRQLARALPSFLQTGNTWVLGEFLKLGDAAFALAEAAFQNPDRLSYPHFNYNEMAAAFGNAVRAGWLDEPTAYRWHACAAGQLGLRRNAETRYVFPDLPVEENQRQEALTWFTNALSHHDWKNVGALAAELTQRWPQMEPWLDLAGTALCQHLWWAEPGAVGEGLLQRWDDLFSRERGGEVSPQTRSCRLTWALLGGDTTKAGQLLARETDVRRRLQFAWLWWGRGEKNFARQIAEQATGPVKHANWLAPAAAVYALTDQTEAARACLLRLRVAHPDWSAAHRPEGLLGPRLCRLLLQKCAGMGGEEAPAEWQPSEAARQLEWLAHAPSGNCPELRELVAGLCA